MRGNTRWTIHNMKKFWKSFKINFILHSKCVKHSDNWVYEQWFQIFFEDVFQDAQNRRNVFEVEVSKFLQVGEPHPLPPLQKKQHKIKVQLTCNEWQVKKRVVLGRHGDLITFISEGNQFFFSIINLDVVLSNPIDFCISINVLPYKTSFSFFKSIFKR